MTKRILSMILCIALAISMFGCGARSSGDAYDGMEQNSSVTSYPQSSAAADYSGADKGEAVSDGQTGVDLNAVIDYTTPTDRKIIITVEYKLETKQFTETVNSILKQVSTVEGYIAASSIDTSDTAATKYAHLELRIPADKLSSFSSYIESTGNVLNKTQSGEDVTLEYFDYENRLSSLRIQQERVMGLLTKAEEMTDILAIETELNRLRTEIEELTTMMKQLENLVDYSTVTINLYEVETYEPIPGDSFLEKLKDSFSDSLNFSLKVLKGFCYGFVWLLPSLVVVAVIIIIIVLAKRAKRKKRAQLAAQWAQNQQIEASKDIEQQNQ